MNLSALSEREGACSDEVPSILSQRDKQPIVLHLTSTIEQDAAERSMQLSHAFVYVLEATGLGLFKIGRSVNFKNRFPAYRSECPVECRPLLVATVPLDRVEEIELALHAWFEHAREKGEWFRLTQEDLSVLPEVVKVVAQQHIDQIRRVVRKQPKTRPSAQEVKWRQDWERELSRVRQAAAVPTDELILDRLLDAQQSGERIDARDITRSIDRRPQVIHEYIRDMICAGQIAIVEPLRNPADGAIWLNAYRQTNLMIPDVTCDWELTICGHEILVSEPLGEFVPEFFGRQRKR